ncbi:MAG: transcriptional regulator [Sulfobacillus benefaciens]|uniref:Transcriptional regulator n=1 Tax=Sulfobacillus benefaciens TaxID=453960 RepID=A0A2T2WYZ0_9FIRM|nr:MAG: transcriptional regulator [Sulfobacillus benefaciens]
MVIGAKIRDLRKKLGLTQEQLAGDELTKSYVSQVELGRIHPSHKALAVIAARLGKPLGYFLENGDDMRTIEVLLKAAQALWNTGRLDEGMLGLQEALMLAERTGREDILARIKATMGRLEMTQGNLDAALEYLEESLTLVHPNEHPAQAVEIANTLGMVATRSGSFHKAMNSFQQALEYAQRLPDEAADVRAEAAQHYGDFCYSQMQWISALELYQQAMADPRQLISINRKTELLGRIASTEWQLGHQDKALVAITNALALLDQIKESEEKAAIGGDLARVLIDTGRFNEAHDLLLQSLETFDRLNFHEGQAVILDALLQLSAAAHSPEWLHQYSQRVLRTQNAWPWHSVKLYALRLLARQAVEVGQLEPARDYLADALQFAYDEERIDIECEYYLIRTQLGDSSALDHLWAHIADLKFTTAKPRPFTPRMPKISAPALSFAGSIT